MKLGVNIDHCASVRRLRDGTEPVIVDCARLCEKSGADSIVVHLREDRRHIRDEDVYALRKTVTTKLNLEMSIAPEIMKVALNVLPDQATLVPEKRKEITTEGGLDVAGLAAPLDKVCARLARSGITVSLFIDPDQKQIRAAHTLGVERLEFHTGRFANAVNQKQRDRTLKELRDACAMASLMGFHVYAGHGLDYDNVGAIIGIPEVEELNIGYSIVCRSITVGLREAVRQMKKMMNP